MIPRKFYDLKATQNPPQDYLRLAHLDVIVLSSIPLDSSHVETLYHYSQPRPSLVTGTLPKRAPQTQFSH